LIVSEDYNNKRSEQEVNAPIITRMQFFSHGDNILGHIT